MDHTTRIELIAGGYTVVTASTAAGVIAHAMTGDFALLLLRGTLPDMDDAALTDRIAQIPGTRGSLPFLIAPTNLPSDDVLRTRIAAAPRSGTTTPDPLARLVPLFGAGGVAMLMQDLHDRLGALLTAPDPCAIGEGTTIASVAHRTAGVAGTLDFPLLAAAWHQVERDGPAHLPAALQETRIAHAALAILLARAAPR